MERFTTEHYPKTKFLFFTGKGGVGKTSVASALSYTLSLENKKVLLVSTDPASNLQDIFQQALTNTPIFNRRNIPLICLKFRSDSSCGRL